MKTVLALLACLSFASFSAVAAESGANTEVSRPQILATMKRATAFMQDKLAYKGGYVWAYLPDMSRRWGEMEAFPTMIWMQPPGTATVGHVYLDAYHATGDDYFYRAAVKVASAVMAAQLPSGGWNYMADLAGEASQRRWYDTIGRNGWRLEEFLHDSGNGTFDDAGTSDAAQFLLRLYLEKRDARFKPALDRAIAFVLDAQYPVGGWPQRWPRPAKRFSYKGKPDYTGYLTLNDDVAAENIKFLIMVYQTLGDRRAYEAVLRAMNAFIVLQQGQPQPGWALQYTMPDLHPVGARSYEPDALTTHTTAQAVGNMLDFYQLTGDTKFLARIPEALDWLDSVALPAELAARTGRTHPTFIAIGSNTPLYVHRRGSNVVNGEYYVDHDPENTLSHYSSFRKINVAKLRGRFEALRAMTPGEASKDSPLLARGLRLPKYFSLADMAVSDLNSGHIGVKAAPEAAQLAALIPALNAEGYWPTPLKATSNPYIGDGAATPAAGDFSRTHVGDASDTSPYIAKTPLSGISTATFIHNMGLLIRQLDMQP